MKKKNKYLYFYFKTPLIYDKQYFLKIFNVLKSECSMHTVKRSHFYFITYAIFNNKIINLHTAELLDKYTAINFINFLFKKINKKFYELYGVPSIQNYFYLVIVIIKI